MTRLMTIAIVGAVALVSTACGGSSPATSTAIEQANRSAGATFGAARAATITIIASTNTVISAANRHATPTARASSPSTGVGMSTAQRATPNGTTAQSLSGTPANVSTTQSLSPPAAVAYERLMTSIAAVDTGELDAVLDHGIQARTVTSMRFNLGDGRNAARTDAVITYQSALATRSTEAITVGGRTWQRAIGTPWAASDRADNARDQIRALLPHGGTTDVGEEERGGVAVLRWYDPDRASDVEVEIDPTSSIPRQMRQISRTDGSILTVTYRSWNTPVTIDSPDGSVILGDEVG